MTTWLVHGFNVWDGGRASIGRLLPYLDGDAQMHDYGWTGALGLHWANRRAVKALSRKVRPGDTIVAHSNGCLIAWELAQAVPLASVVCINPALRRDTRWPVGLPVLCLHNSTDWVVQLGRWWGRLFPFDGIETQGWGAAGRYGFTAPHLRLLNIDTAMGQWDKPVKGHSGVFGEAAYWGEIVDRWVHDQPEQCARAGG